MFCPQQRQEIVGVAFCHPFPPCTPPAVPEMVELGLLEGAPLPLLFKGTCLKTMKSWNPFLNLSAPQTPVASNFTSVSAV